jgi:hypothetical protein
VRRSTRLRGVQFPALTLSGDGALIGLTKRINCSERLIAGRLEALIDDPETVEAVYQAATAYHMQSGRPAAEWEIGLCPSSYNWLERNQMALSGDSLGLACFFLLAGIPNDCLKSRSHRLAVTGALSVSDNAIRIRPVERLYEKAELACRYGCDDLVMPNQPVDEERLKLLPLECWRVLDNLTFLPAGVQ